MIYLINNDIEFLYNESLLISRSLNENRKLLAPSTKILKHLIDNHGDLATQHELFKIGWGEKEKYVTNNAFYQNILLIRKAFEDLQLTDNIITTVPRKGYLIKTEIHIEKIKPTLKSIDNTSTIDNNKINIDNELTLKRYLTNKIKNKKNIFILLLFLFLFIILFKLINADLSDNDRSLYNYEFCGDLQDKEIYCNYDNYHDDTYLDLIEKEIFKLNNKYRIIYLTSYKYKDRFSFLVCENKFARFNLFPNDCISYYIIGKNPNENK